MRPLSVVSITDRVHQPMPPMAMASTGMNQERNPNLERRVLTVESPPLRRRFFVLRIGIREPYHRRGVPARYWTLASFALLRIPATRLLISETMAR